VADECNQIEQSSATAKHQWQCKSTPYWVKKSMESNFLMIMHEHLFVFRKSGEGEKVKKFKESMA